MNSGTGSLAVDSVDSVVLNVLAVDSVAYIVVADSASEVLAVNSLAYIQVDSAAVAVAVAVHLVGVVLVFDSLDAGYLFAGSFPEYSVLRV